MKTSMLYDIGLYKNKILNHLLNCRELAEVLLRKDNPTKDEARALQNTQIFPFLYVQDSQDIVKSYLCYEIEISASANIKDLTLTVYVYSHKDCMEYFIDGYQGTTNDIISDIFTQQIEKCEDFGIGKWDLSSTWHFFPNSSYYGRTLTFKTSDFKNKVKNK